MMILSSSLKAILWTIAVSVSSDDGPVWAWTRVDELSVVATTAVASKNLRITLLHEHLSRPNISGDSPR
jgi:hypothetical protein